MEPQVMGFERPVVVIVIGGRGGVGQALSHRIAHALPQNDVISTSRNDSWVRSPESVGNITRLSLDLTNEASCMKVADMVKQKEHAISAVINASGMLHDGDLQPERTWRHLTPEKMARSFEVNTIGAAMAVKHLLPLIGRRDRGIFASLSARVGSISDNRLGGWYSYRASKAAQHMILKCAAIEAKRLYPHLVCVALHPGTVDTALSAPFTARTPPERLFTPTQSADYLLRVLAELGPSDSGGVFAWDGQQIQY